MDLVECRDCHATVCVDEMCRGAFTEQYVKVENEDGTDNPEYLCLECAKLNLYL